jgi:hypothetical protein
MAVLALVVGIEMGASVVTAVDDALDVATSGSNFSLTGVILPFVPVIYVAGIMGIAGLIGVFGGVTSARDTIQQIILSVIALLIGVFMITTVINSSQNMLDAIAAATATFAIANVIVPFLPVIYVASILALAGLPWLGRLRTRGAF